MFLGNAVAQRALALTTRRHFLCERMPACPKCTERRQIQLRYWVMPLARWKCRTCKTKFVFEPLISK